MKKLFIFLGVSGALVVIALTLAIFNAQSIVSSLQPQLEEQAASVLKTPVKLGKVEFSIIPQIQLVAPQVALGKGDKSLKVKEVKLSFDWLPMIWGEANAEIEVLKPEITVEKTTKGFQIAGLSENKDQPGSTASTSKKASSSPAEKKPTKSKAESNAVAGPIRINLNRIAVTDGEIRLLNMVPDPQAPAIILQKFNFLAGINLNEIITLKNLSIETTETTLGKIAGQLERVILNPGTMEVSWSGLDFDAVGTRLKSQGTLKDNLVNLTLLKGSETKIQQAIAATQLMPKLNKSLAPFKAEGLLEFELETQMDLTSAALPQLSGLISIKDLKASLQDRKLEKLDATIKLDSIEGQQQFSVSPAQVIFSDPGALTRPLELLLEIKNGVLRSTENIDIASWTVKFAESLLGGSLALENSVVNLKVGKEVSKIKLAPLKEYLKALVAHQVSGAIKPQAKVTANLKTMAYMAEGNLELEKIGYEIPNTKIENLKGILSFQGNQNEAKATSSNIEYLLNTLPLKLAFESSASESFKNFSLQSFNLSGLDKGFSGKGNFKLPGAFSFQATADSLGIAPLVQLAQMDKIASTSGHLKPFEMNIRGNLQNLFPSLQGKISTNGDSVKIIGFNLVGTILEKINNISLISGGLTKSAPEIFTKYTKNKDTDIERFHFDSIIDDAKLKIKNYEVAGDVFRLAGRGEVSLPHNHLNLDARFEFNREFSQALASAVKEIDRITDSGGKLVFPVRITGTPPNLTVLPDFSELLNIAAKKAITKGAEKLLDKALSGKKLFNW